MSGTGTVHCAWCQMLLRTLQTSFEQQAARDLVLQNDRQSLIEIQQADQICRERTTRDLDLATDRLVSLEARAEKMEGVADEQDTRMESIAAQLTKMDGELQKLIQNLASWDTAWEQAKLDERLDWCERQCDSENHDRRQLFDRMARCEQHLEWADAAIEFHDQRLAVDQVDQDNLENRMKLIEELQERQERHLVAEKVRHDREMQTASEITGRLHCRIDTIEKTMAFDFQDWQRTKEHSASLETRMESIENLMKEATRRTESIRKLASECREEQHARQASLENRIDSIEKLTKDQIAGATQALQNATVQSDRFVVLQHQRAREQERHLEIRMESIEFATKDLTQQIASLENRSESTEKLTDEQVAGILHASSRMESIENLTQEQQRDTRAIHAGQEMTGKRIWEAEWRRVLLEKRLESLENLTKGLTGELRALKIAKDRTAGNLVSANDGRSTPPEDGPLENGPLEVGSEESRLVSVPTPSENGQLKAGSEEWRRRFAKWAPGAEQAAGELPANARQASLENRLDLLENLTEVSDLASANDLANDLAGERIERPISTISSDEAQNRLDLLENLTEVNDFASEVLENLTEVNESDGGQRFRLDLLENLTEANDLAWERIERPISTISSDEASDWAEL